MTRILPPSVLAAQHVGADGTVHDRLGTLAPDARFAIASITKTLVAMLAARLCEDGELAWDEPLAASRGAAPVTLRRLLRHDAAVPLELHPAQWGNVSLTDAQLTDALADPPRLPLPPGTWHYSNLGYAMAGRVLERATGRRLDALLADRLLGPLGMTRTSFPDERTDGPAVFGPAAAAAGDLFSTLEDLTTFAGALEGRRPDVVSWRMLALLLDGAIADGDGVHYGAAIRTHAVGRHRVLVCIGHVGDRRSCVAVWPRRGASIVVAEAACDRDAMWRWAAERWRREDAHARTWWLDGQEVAELRHGDEVELLLGETTWPYPLFSGRDRGGTLAGVDWRGEPLELDDRGAALVGAGVRLTADVDDSAAPGERS